MLALIGYIPFISKRKGCHMIKHLLCVIAASLCASANAATVYKCTGENGKTTFSDRPCADGGEVVTKTAPRPSGDGPSIKLADPAKVPPVQRTRRTYNHCGELTQVDIVHANSRGQVILGMTAEDVRNSWGSPRQINRSADGEQWVYPLDEYRSRYLYIDNYGCFTYWN